MILADKIILLRKKNGWSQEELAQQLNVSRQAVSKWEGAQATPDLERILRMSQVFGVSTDYLLKDEVEETPATPAAVPSPEDTASTRVVTLEEAYAFLAAKEATVGRIALGTFLCVLAPLPIILLSGISTFTALPLSENTAAAVGITLLIGLTCAAVLLFLSCRKHTAAFDYLETEVIETAYGVKGMVQQEKKNHEASHGRMLFAACCLAVLCPLPLLLSALLNAPFMLLLVHLCLTILLGGVAAILFILRGVPRESYDKLLEEGDYTRARKTSPVPVGAISTAYWLLVVALYLGYCLTTNRWEMSGVIWAVAGVLFAALSLILNSIAGRKRS